MPHRPQFSASDVVSRHTPSHRSTPSPSHGCPLGVALLVDALVDVTVVEDAADVLDTDEARDDDDGTLLLLFKLTDTLLTVDELELLLAKSDNELLLDS